MPSLIQPVLVSALVAHDLAKAYGDHVVLDGIDVVAQPGQPLGVVGENGAGKSTLLRLLAGAEAPDAGSIIAPADLGYLPQEPTFEAGITVGQVLDDALAPLREAVRLLEEVSSRLDEPEAAEEYAAVLAHCEAHDAWDADRRAEMAAARLGLASVDPSRPVSSLSGGERSRLALAALVVRRPACVLLDEPTNHLDDGALEFLEQYLSDLPGVVIVASHDRTFLTNVCGELLDLDPAALGTDGVGGRTFTGSYPAYLEAKRAARARWEQQFETEQDELNRLREAAATTARQVAPGRGPRDNDKFIHHFKAGNVERTISRRVRNTERRFDELDQVQVPKPPAPLVFRGGFQRGRPAKVQVRDLVIAGRLSLPRLDLKAGEHLLVTGTNGSGKSTLLTALAGHLAPTSGSAHVDTKRIGYLPQDVNFSRPDRSALSMYDAATSGRFPLRHWGLLHPRDHARPIGVLSHGQQRRLALAVVLARQPDLVLLDEPTNHISLTLAEELEEAVSQSPITVIVASHDRWLRGRWDGSVLAL